MRKSKVHQNDYQNCTYCMAVRTMSRGAMHAAKVVEAETKIPAHQTYMLTIDMLVEPIQYLLKKCGHGNPYKRLKDSN